MPFEEGKEKTGGRTKGTPNKLTKTVKERVLDAFNELQEDAKANLVTWGKENPHHFYQIAAKLIPTEVNTQITSDGIANLVISHASKRKDGQSDTDK